jgi:dihydropteroate synthase
VEISAKEEILRVKNAMKAIREVSEDTLVSIDSFRCEVVKIALSEGVFMVNDISGGTLDDKMFDFIGKENMPYVMMHMQGNPQTMQSLTDYENLTQSVFSFFQQKKKELNDLGANQIVLDPGFGFAKTLDQNYELLSEMELLASLGSPLLVGVSRKSMIYKLLEVEAKEALNGTSVLNTVALLKGASILRVHDVKEARETVTLVSKL